MNTQHENFGSTHEKYCANHSIGTSISRQQEGATLIVTLFGLLIISIIALIAFRQSNTDLNISTSSQVNKVVFQSSELALSMLEKQAINEKLNQEGNLIPHMKMPGTSNERIGNEITFCVRPRDPQFFSLNSMSEKSALGGHVGLQNGYCKPDDSDDDYTSARNTNVLQMTVEKRKPSAGSEAFRLENDRSTVGGAQITSIAKPFTPVEFKATSVALLPAFSKADLSDVQDCLPLSAKEKGMTISADQKVEPLHKCLNDEAVPVKITEQGYVYRVFTGL